MRISDWSSDVCSSDLHTSPRGAGAAAGACPRGTTSRTGWLLGARTPGPPQRRAQAAKRWRARWGLSSALARWLVAPGEAAELHAGGAGNAAGDEVEEIGRASCRERVCQYV